MCAGGLLVVLSLYALTVIVIVLMIKHRPARRRQVELMQVWLADSMRRS